MVELKKLHWTATKHVLRYLQGTIEYGIKYTRGDGVKLMDYTNVEWAGNIVDKKSTSR